MIFTIRGKKYRTTEKTAIIIDAVGGFFALILSFAAVYFLMCVLYALQA